jgi:hypothetical protein
VRLMFDSKKQASDVLSLSGSGFVMDHHVWEKLLWCKNEREVGKPILVRKGAWTLLGPEVQGAVNSLRSQLTEIPKADVFVQRSWQDTVRTLQAAGTKVHISAVPNRCSGSCATGGYSCLQ